MELEKTENGLFFHNGWQRFVKDHHLEVGDFLIFRYDGESKFNVTIYDRSACEKDVEVAKTRSNSSVSLGSNGNQAQVKEEVVDLETENYYNNKVSKNETVIADKKGCKLYCILCLLLYSLFTYSFRIKLCLNLASYRQLCNVRKETCKW